MPRRYYVFYLFIITVVMLLTITLFWPVESTATGLIQPEYLPVFLILEDAPVSAPFMFAQVFHDG
jgi:hypothetical protein